MSKGKKTLPLMFAAACVALLGLSACKERPQESMQAVDGKYKGKAYSAPYKNAEERGKWEGELRTRAQNQNEYVRINN